MFCCITLVLGLQDGKCFRQPSEILLGIYNIRDGMLSFKWVRGTQWVKGWIYKTWYKAPQVAEIGIVTQIITQKKRRNLDIRNRNQVDSATVRHGFA